MKSACVRYQRMCVCVKGDSQPLKHCSKTVPYKIFIHTYADVVLDVVYMPMQNQHYGFFVIGRPPGFYQQGNYYHKTLL